MNEIEKMKAAAAARVAELGGQLIVHADGSFAVADADGALVMRQGTLDAAAGYIDRMIRHRQQSAR
jgi:hypothetical protein